MRRRAHSLKFRDLRLHRVKMSNNPEHENVTYNCDMCKFKSKFRKELMQHKQLKHGQTYLLSLTEKTLSKFVFNIAINTSITLLELGTGMYFLLLLRFWFSSTYPPSPVIRKKSLCWVSYKCKIESTWAHNRRFAVVDAQKLGLLRRVGWTSPESLICKSKQISLCNVFYPFFSNGKILWLYLE